MKTRAEKGPAGRYGGLWTIVHQLLGKCLYSQDDYEVHVFPVVLICCASSACNVKYPHVGLRSYVESISRTVTCTGELSALIRVIPRGK